MHFRCNLVTIHMQLGKKVKTRSKLDVTSQLDQNNEILIKSKINRLIARSKMDQQIKTCMHLDAMVSE